MMLSNYNSRQVFDIWDSYILPTKDLNNGIDQGMFLIHIASH